MEDQFEPERKRIANMVVKLMKHPDWVGLFTTNVFNRYISVASGEETLSYPLKKFSEKGAGSVLIFEGDPGALCILELLEPSTVDAEMLDENELIKHFSARVASWPEEKILEIEGSFWKVRVVDHGRMLDLTGS